VCSTEPREEAARPGRQSAEQEDASYGNQSGLGCRRRGNPELGIDGGAERFLLFFPARGRPAHFAHLGDEIMALFLDPGNAAADLVFSRLADGRDKLFACARSLVGRPAMAMRSWWAGSGARDKCETAGDSLSGGSGRLRTMSDCADVPAPGGRGPGKNSGAPSTVYMAGRNPSCGAVSGTIRGWRTTVGRRWGRVGIRQHWSPEGR